MYRKVVLRTSNISVKTNPAASYLSSLFATGTRVPSLGFFSANSPQDPKHPVVQFARLPQVELREMALALNLDPSNDKDQLLAFSFTNYKVEKALTFEIIRQMMSKVSTKDPDEFNRIAEEFYNYFISSGKIELLEKIYHDLYKEGQEQAEQFIDSLLNDSQEMLEQMSHDPALLRVKQVPTSDKSVDVVREVVVHSNYSRRLHEFVADELENQMQTGKIRRLPSKETNSYFMIAGPAASGKGLITRKLIENGSINMMHLCRLTPDDYHPLLDLGGKIIYRSPTQRGDYSHELLAATMKNVEHDLEHMRSTQNQAPDIIKEVIVITQARINDAMKSGKNLYCFVAVHDSPDLIVEGAMQRFNSTGRYVSPHYICNGQRGVSIMMPEAVEELVKSNDSKQANIVFYETTFVHDKATKESKNPVATADSTSKKFIIFQLDKLIKFNARKDLTLTENDAEQESATNEQLVNEFLTSYANVLDSMVLVDPDFDPTKDSNVNEHIYAHFDPVTKSFVIDDDEIYKKVAGNSPLSALFIDKVCEKQSAEATKQSHI